MQQRQCTMCSSPLSNNGKLSDLILQCGWCGLVPRHMYWDGTSSIAINLLSFARLSRRTPGTHCTTTHQQGWRCTSQCTVDLTTLSTNSFFFLFFETLVFFIKLSFLFLLDRSLPYHRSIDNDQNPVPADSNCAPVTKSEPATPSLFLSIIVHQCLGLDHAGLCWFFLFSLRIGQVLRLFVKSFCCLNVPIPFEDWIWLLRVNWGEGRFSPRLQRDSVSSWPIPLYIKSLVYPWGYLSFRSRMKEDNWEKEDKVVILFIFKIFYMTLCPCSFISDVLGSWQQPHAFDPWHCPCVWCRKQRGAIHLLSFYSSPL